MRVRRTKFRRKITSDDRLSVGAASENRHPRTLERRSGRRSGTVFGTPDFGPARPSRGREPARRAWLWASGARSPTRRCPERRRPTRRGRHSLGAIACSPASLGRPQMVSRETPPAGRRAGPCSHVHSPRGASRRGGRRCRSEARRAPARRPSRWNPTSGEQMWSARDVIRDGGEADQPLCGGQLCRVGQFCCGPPACGRCAYPMAGPHCPGTCQVRRATSSQRGSTIAIARSEGG